MSTMLRNTFKFVDRAHVINHWVLVQALFTHLILYIVYGTLLVCTVISLISGSWERSHERLQSNRENLASTMSANCQTIHTNYLCMWFMWWNMEQGWQNSSQVDTLVKLQLRLRHLKMQRFGLLLLVNMNGVMELNIQAISQRHHSPYTDVIMWS